MFTDKSENAQKAKKKSKVTPQNKSLESAQTNTNIDISPSIVPPTAMQQIIANIQTSPRKNQTKKPDEVEDKDESEFTNIDKQFQYILDALGGLRSYVTQVQCHIRILEKNVKKQERISKKNITKTKGQRKPSGFAKPSKISDQLITFMNKNDGDEVARTEVTQYIIKYIKENNLQNKENKKVITPDDKLNTLLECGDNEVTYFNLQKFMNRHFIKEV